MLIFVATYKGISLVMIVSESVKSVEATVK